jgi:hypothetical protein
MKYLLHAGHSATIRRMGKFDGISWTCCRSNGSTKTKDEATANELSHRVGGRLDGSSDEDEQATDEDTDTTAVTISKQTAT